MPGAKRHVLLVGEMGAGKTTLGAALAKQLGRPFHDSDAFVVAATGESGSVIADRDGVPRLHAVELDAFIEMVSTSQPAVIAPAASVVDSEAGREQLRRHWTVWLTAPADVLADRWEPGDHRREVSRAEQVAILERRATFYEDVSQFAVDTGNSSVDELALDLTRRVHEIVEGG
jgi:shikimate kinase